MKKLKDNPKTWKVFKKGNEWLDYVYSEEEEGLSKFENFVFSATLKPMSYYRGRSAAGFLFKDVDTGDEFTMRISCLSNLLEKVANGSVKIVNKGFKADFTFVKQGSNYSLDVYEEDK